MEGTMAGILSLPVNMKVTNPLPTFWYSIKLRIKVKFVLPKEHRFVINR